MKKQGFNSKDINRVANLIYIEYKDNIKIGDQSPDIYWNKFIRDLSWNDIQKIYSTYDIPSKFPNMEYLDFLKDREKLMVKRIKND